MDSFFRNFFRQCKEPSRFGFYRIAADQAENLLGVMKELLKDPEANKDMISGTYGYDGTEQTIVRLEHGEPDFGEATNPAGQGLWRVTPKVLSNSKHTLLCL